MSEAKQGGMEDELHFSETYLTFIDVESIIN